MTKQEGEDKPKKRKGFIVIIIFFALIEIGLLVTGFVYIFGALAGPGIPDSEQVFKGLYFIYGFMGGLVLFLPIIMISFVISRRKAITKTFHNITSSITASVSTSAAALAPYSASYRPSKKGNVYYCDYCGYEVRNDERECPECSGPIKRGKRVS